MTTAIYVLTIIGTGALGAWGGISYAVWRFTPTIREANEKYFQVGSLAGKLEQTRRTLEDTSKAATQWHEEYCRGEERHSITRWKLQRAEQRLGEAGVE